MLDLATQASTLPGIGLRVLFVPLAESCANLSIAQAALTCISTGGTVAATAYALLSRTLAHAGRREELVPMLQDAAFLIDRFGYLRARWLPGDELAPWSAQQLRRIQQALADEPQIRAAPELHVH